MLNRIRLNSNFLEHLTFNNEFCFHASWLVSRYNFLIWGHVNSHKVHEQEQNIPKVKVWLGMHIGGIIGPFFFIEYTVTRHIYLDMLKNCCSTNSTRLSVSNGWCSVWLSQQWNQLFEYDIPWLLAGKMRTNCLGIKISIFDSVRLFV